MFDVLSVSVSVWHTICLIRLQSAEQRVRVCNDPSWPLCRLQRTIDRRLSETPVWWWWAWRCCTVQDNIASEPKLVNKGRASWHGGQDGKHALPPVQFQKGGRSRATSIYRLRDGDPEGTARPERVNGKAAPGRAQNQLFRFRVWLGMLCFKFFSWALNSSC